MTPGRLLAAFAFYAAALELGASWGLVAAVASPAGALLLAGAGALFGVRAVAAARAPGPRGARAARVLVAAGAALALLGIPASFATRDTRTATILEGETEPLLPGRPPVRFGPIALAPRGPHLLSKTVSIPARAADGGEVEIGLFPPRRVEGALVSVYRFGYAARVRWSADDGRALWDGPVLLGTLEHREEDAALVAWTPEPNVMMGAGTFPPRLEELVSPPGRDAHLFLRLEAATVAGARRDLRDPDAYRWLVDGRLEDPVLFAQVFRGREKVFEGKVRAGERVEYDGGELSLEPRVLLWVDLLVTRDAFLPWAGLGLALLAAGLALHGGIGARRLLGRRPRPAAGGPGGAGG